MSVADDDADVPPEAVGLDAIVVAPRLASTDTRMVHKGWQGPGRKRNHGEFADDIREELEREQGKEMMKDAQEAADHRRTDTLWDAWKQFYVIAELMWKNADTDYINTPGHVCEPGVCELRNERLNLHRDRGWSNDDMVAALTKTVAGQVTNYHVCFPRVCPHYGQHACKDAEACPHHPSRKHKELVRAMPHAWICTNTGTLHVCGPYCKQRSITSVREGQLICPLLGVKVADTFGTLYDPSHQLPNPINHQLLSVDEYENTVRDRVVLATKLMKPWEREADMLQYRALAGLILNTLLFSEARQLLEVRTIVEAHEKGAAEAAKVLRPRKNRDMASETGWRPDMAFRGFHRRAQGRALPLMSVRYGMAILATFHPRTRYFHVVPPMPNVIPVMREAACTTPGLQQHPIIPHVRHHGARCLHCVREATRARIRQQIATITPDSARAEPMTWGSDTWQRFMANSKKLIIDMALRIWINLNKVTYDPERGREDLPFPKIVLAVIYLMRTEYSIPIISHVYDATLTRKVPRVIVIPRLNIASLLPPETALPHFEMPKPCSGVVKALTTTQSAIKERFSRLVRDGFAFDIQMSMEGNN